MLRAWFPLRTKVDADFSDLTKRAKDGNVYAATTVLSLGGGVLTGNLPLSPALLAYLSEILCNAAEAADFPKGKERNAAIAKALNLVGTRGRAAYENEKRDSDICQGVDYLRSLGGSVSRGSARSQWSVFDVANRWLADFGIDLKSDAIRTIYEAREKK
jgi:hypothetical protein